jgi:two-component system cell cycle response regulator
MSKGRVLIAEDDPVSLRLVETMLHKWGYEPVPARDGSEAWEVLQAEDAPQLAILDWMMPKRDGLDVCRALRQDTARPYVYVLLLTAKVQEEDLVEGLEAGADDYLTKPFAGEELRARIFAGERILAIQQQLVSAREDLRNQAIRDVLTGLFNRRYMQEALDRELHRAQCGGTPLTLLMFDLDHFKTFNDTWGHEAGDLILKRIGNLMEARTRREDVACRFGGEEFVIILPGMTLDVASRRAEDFRQGVGQLKIEHRRNMLPSPTVSIGLACFPQHATTSEGLLRAADEALYCAKDRGRDCVVIHQDVQASAPGTGAQTRASATKTGA